MTGDSGQKPKTVTITRITGYGVPKYTPSCNGRPFERLDRVISHFAALEKAASCFCRHPLKARFFQWAASIPRKEIQSCVVPLLNDVLRLRN